MSMTDWQDIKSQIAREGLLAADRDFSWGRTASAVVRGFGSRHLLLLHRLAEAFAASGAPRRARALRRRINRLYGCYLAPGAQLGDGALFPHPVGIVIGEGVVVGRNCRIYQQVTVGGARTGDYEASNYPEIGEDVTIFAGARILGAIRIGDGAIIGANAVVTKDVPARHVAVGIPATARPIGDTPRKAEKAEPS